MSAKPFTKEQVIERWTEIMRLISVGAYTERSAEHYEAGTWPEDGIEESEAYFETWAEKQGLEFCFNHDSKEWSLVRIDPGQEAEDEPAS